MADEQSRTTRSVCFGRLERMKQLASKAAMVPSNSGSRAQAIPAINRKGVFLPIVKGGGASGQTKGREWEGGRGVEFCEDGRKNVS